MGITDVLYGQYQQTQYGNYNQNKRGKAAEKYEEGKNVVNNHAQKLNQNITDSKEKVEKTAEKAARYDRTSALETYDLSKLSTKAQDYLEKLKEKYNMADIIIADYATDEEAQAYMAGAKKDYAVVITPDLLEKMATDEEAQTKYEGIIDQAMGNMTTIKEQLGEDADKVSGIGMTVDDDGNVKYFAMLDEQRVRDSERQEALKEKRAEEKKAEKKEEAQEKQEERITKKTKTIKADSIEELIEKIRNYKGEEEKEVELTFAKTAQEEAKKGAAIDFSL